MRIFLLAEQRSGSINLCLWFDDHPDFTIIHQPLTKLEYGVLSGVLSNKININTNPSDYYYKTKHLIIKQDHGINLKYDSIINTCDKHICLYRENFEDQFESLLNAKLFNNWRDEWRLTEKQKNHPKRNEYYLDFKKTKDDFEKRFLNNPKFFKISYEDLYYRDKIDELINYIETPEIKNKKFPIGTRYRSFTKINKTI